MAFKRKESEGKAGASDFIPVGALWPGKKEGVLSGKFNRDTTAFQAAVEKVGLEGLRIVVLENSFKKTDKDPVVKIFVTIADNQASKAQGEAPAPKAAPKSKMPWDKA